MSQQKQDDEERRRQEEEGIAEAIAASDRAFATDRRIQRHRDITTRYDSSGDMTPDGRNIAYWNRAIVVPQMQAIHELNARGREKK